MRDLWAFAGVRGAREQCPVGWRRVGTKLDHAGAILANNLGNFEAFSIALFPRSALIL
jgi:hypothetical protein